MRLRTIVRPTPVEGMVPISSFELYYGGQDLVHCWMPRVSGWTSGSGISGYSPHLDKAGEGSRMWCTNATIAQYLSSGLRSVYAKARHKN